MPYAFLLRHVLRRADAERTHEWALGALRVLASRRTLGRPLGAALRPRDPRLAVDALGRTFPSPLGVAAGLDKNAVAFEPLAALGFGFVEVGSVTARPQGGNPRPRVHRLIGSRALLNSMGFPNDGAEAVARRLRAPRGTIVGVNVGKSRDVGLDDAAADYARALALLGPTADYVVLNVSSPNTPGLRVLQAADRLGALAGDARRALRDAGSRAPLLLKIAPDVTDAELDAVADLALAGGADGIVAVNTTLAREGLEPAALDVPGGVSGAPLKQRALAVLARLYARVGERVPLISVGGIETAEDAWTRILAGATLLQAYTGFVYGGPLWPLRISRGLLARLDAAGAASPAEVRGTAARAAGAPARRPAARS